MGSKNDILLSLILDSIDATAYAFDRERTITYANATAKKKGVRAGAKLGAGEDDHFKYNEYYDIDGNRLPYPKDSAVERAFKGIETRGLILEHRSSKSHTAQWLTITCIPKMNEKGEFEHAVLWYRDISKNIHERNKLRFLVEAQKILTVASDLDERLCQKAKLLVPSLADGCEITVVEENGTLRQVALVHRDQKRVEWFKKVREKQLAEQTETIIRRVVRTGEHVFIPLVTDALIDLHGDPSPEYRKDTKEMGLTSVMVLPIYGKTKDVVLGTFSVAYVESGRVYTQQDLEFFTEFCSHLTIVFQNSQLYDEISRRDLAKDAFLASLSHELRNPLAPIKSALEIVHIHNKDAALREDLDLIDHQFDHMSRLLNDLLDTTRLMQGKINLNKNAESVTEIMQILFKSIAPVAKERGVDLRIAYPANDMKIFVDRTRLEQAITNVLNNSVKFTPKGGSIDISFGGNEREVSIIIRDTGAGITEEEMQHIFEPYYQGERVRYGNSGLGVGLRLVHEIIRLHNGTVEAHSAGMNKGSEFTVTIPRARENVRKLQDTEIELRHIASKNILVVDDNIVAADSLVRLLKALGWKAHAVYSASDALEFLNQNDANIIFLDIGMPKMNGYELVKILRGQGKIQLPIIAVTGYGLEEDKTKAKAAGFTAHMTKPIGVSDINKILAEVGELRPS